MGLLETLITNAIRQSTGFDAGQLVRRIGAKNILLAGGALIAGGLAAERYRQAPGGASGGSSAGAPPRPGTMPPPPPPAFAPPPPPAPPSAAGLPPIPRPAAAPVPPALATDSVALPPEVTFPIVRTMIAAALADGRMSPEERVAIQQQLGTSGLSEEQTAQVHHELVLPASPEEIATFAAAPEARAVLYRFAALALTADRACSPAERAWLDRLAAALELAGEIKTELEQETLAALA